MKKIFALATAAVMLAGCVKVNTPLSITPSSVKVAVGATVSVSISFDTDASAISELVSEDPAIALAKGTLITGVSAGKTRVYARQHDDKGNIVATAYCSVTVTE